MIRIHTTNIARLALTGMIAAGSMFAPAVAQAGCSRWNLGENFTIGQTNSGEVIFYLKQSNDGLLTGTATFFSEAHVRAGPVDGTIRGDAIEFTVHWPARSTGAGINYRIGKYSGLIGPTGRMEGTTYDAAHSDSRASWYSVQRFGCLAAAAAPPPPKVPPPAAPVIALGRVRARTAPTGPARTLCESAADARARNSPAASGLERQCAALNEQQAPLIAGLPDLAARGETLASADPRSASLREQQPEGAVRTGFDIGLGAAENQTAPGPGKDRIRATLGVREQAGFDVGVSYALDRNRNAELVATGERIIGADPSAAAERERDLDVRYQLGFDIATAIFGDPALGAKGNTATGPGSLGIRDALNATSQRGFNAAVAYHLARTY